MCGPKFLGGLGLRWGGLITNQMDFKSPKEGFWILATPAACNETSNINGSHSFKAASNQYFYITCNVKGVTDKVTENNLPTLQFPSALQSVLSSFCSLFLFLRLASSPTLLFWPALVTLVNLISSCMCLQFVPLTQVAEQITYYNFKHVFLNN